MYLYQHFCISYLYLCFCAFSVTNKNSRSAFLPVWWTMYLLSLLCSTAQLLNCSACSQLAVCPSLSQELLNLPFADQLQHWRLQHWGGFNWKRPLVLNQLWGQYWFAALTTVATFQSLSQKWLKSNFASKSKLQNPILGPQMGKWETPYQIQSTRPQTAHSENWTHPCVPHCVI